MTYEFHPVADIFPMMSSEKFDLLCADIQANGVYEPIFLAIDPADGKLKIADGRHRYNACQRTGAEPHFEEWDGEGDLLTKVVSLNLHRRHLNESQRAMIAARLANMKQGRNPKTADAVFVSQTEASKILNVSADSISRAAKVQNQGIPELSELVEKGDMSVTEAATVAQMSPKKQKAHIKRGRRAKKSMVRRIKEQSLQEAVKGKATCVVCRPGIEDTDMNFLAAVQFLSAQFPRHARYLADIENELADESLLGSTLDGRNKILALIESGITELAVCRQASGLSNDEFEHIKADMIYHNIVEIVTQGGKTDAARGARKELFRLIEKPEESGELTYDIDSDFPEDVYYEPIL